MLGQRRRRWSKIKPTLGQCIELTGIVCTVGQTSAEHWVSVEDAGQCSAAVGNSVQ